MTNDVDENVRSPSSWIKLNRNILGWRWYQDANTFRVFLHLLLTANVRDHDFETDTIHRGECVVSMGKLAATLGITYDQTRTALTHLKETNEITITRRPKYLVISITNYDRYQDNPNQNPNKSQSNPNQIPIKSQYLKNNKKYKKEKKYISSEEDAKKNFGGVFLTDDEWDELSSLTQDQGAFLEVIDKVGEWLHDNPIPKKKHKGIVKTFMRNDGLIG